MLYFLLPGIEFVKLRKPCKPEVLLFYETDEEDPNQMVLLKIPLTVTFGPFRSCKAYVQFQPRNKTNSDYSLLSVIIFWFAPL